MEEYIHGKRASRPPLRRFSELLAAAVLGGIIVLGSLPLLLPYMLPDPEPILPWEWPEQQLAEQPDIGNQQDAVIVAVNQVSPAVVGVTRMAQTEDWLGRKTGLAPTGYGSGVIISPEGYIVTNFHVIEGAVSVVVTLSDGQEAEAEIVGSDEGTDLAVLKISPSENPLSWARLGDSGKLTPGQYVLAIGNPGGLELERSVTLGIISATDRSFDVYDWVFGLLQTDAAINPGNSGGPLVNLNGEVIGINSVKITDAEGLGFSIPSNLVKSISSAIIKDGRVIRPMLGVTISEVSQSLAEAYDLASDYGLLVIEAPSGGPAQKAGIRANDIIVEVQGRNIKNLRDLRQVLSAYQVGQQVDVKVIRGNTSVMVTVTLANLDIR